MSRRPLIVLAMTLTLLGIAAAAYLAGGGRIGLALWYVRHFEREDNAAFREVRWQQGPASRPHAAAPSAADAKPGSDSNARAASARGQPNIILIVVDDLGFDDLTVQGRGVADGAVATPHIDSLARGGVRFDVAYAANATCAPSRAAIMTGRYPTRFGFEFTPTPPRFMKLLASGDGRNAPGATPRYFAEREAGQPAYEAMGLPTDEITLARLLRGSGYHSVHIGKWHLGDSPRFRAYAHGFNESLSLQHGASMYLPAADPRVVTAEAPDNLVDQFILAAEPWGVRFNDGEVFRPDRYLTDYLTDEAIRAVDANRGRPFFLYLAYTAPHTPLQATREDYDALAFIEDRTLRVYAAMLRSLDRNIGRLLAALRERGLERDTLVIFTSDNGAPHYAGIGARNQPLRGWKGTYFEGGVRVPLFLHWPASLPAGARAAGPAAHFDIFATAAAAAGAELPRDRVIDGVDLLPYARGEARGRPHERLFWRTDGYVTMREGDWKLQLTTLPRRTWLYDLATDPLERRNLASLEPARVAAMKAAIVEFDSEQSPPLWRSLAAVPIPLDRTLQEPPRAGEEFVYFSN